MRVRTRLDCKNSAHQPLSLKVDLSIIARQECEDLLNAEDPAPPLDTSLYSYVKPQSIGACLHAPVTLSNHISLRIPLFNRRQEEHSPTGSKYINVLCLSSGLFNWVHPDNPRFRFCLLFETFPEPAKDVWSIGNWKCGSLEMCSVAKQHIAKIWVYLL